MENGEHALDASLPEGTADDSIDIFRVNDAMSERGWALNGLHRPPALHVAVTQRQTEREAQIPLLRGLAARLGG